VLCQYIRYQRIVLTCIGLYWWGSKKLQCVAHVGEAVEVAVGDGFHDVVVEDVGGAFEVGDGAGDFKNAVVELRTFLT